VSGYQKDDIDVNYTFQFSVVFARLPYLLGGALLTLEMAFMIFWGAAIIGLFGAMGKTFGSPAIKRLIDIYVVFFTNTPAFVQVYFLFNGLPDAGILLSPFSAAVIGLTINSGAYLTVIQRAGFSSVRRTELEAAEVLGMNLWQSVRFVILPHIVRTIYAPLANFFIWILLGTSMSAVIGVEELTGRAINISSSTLRSIEVFIVVAVMYIVMTIFASMTLYAVGRFFFRVRMRVI
jgi:polar amino acid transport system permease protein